MFTRGEAFVWLTGSAMGLCLVLVFGLIFVIVINGMGMFWPHQVTEFKLKEGPVYVGIHTRSEVVKDEQGGKLERYQVKVGNRESGADFMWMDVPKVEAKAIPKDVIVLERFEYGDFIGYVSGFQQDGVLVPGADAKALLAEKLPQAQEAFKKVSHIQRGEMENIATKVNKLKLRKDKLAKATSDKSQEIAKLDAQLAVLLAENNKHSARILDLNKDPARYGLVVKSADGVERVVPMPNIVRYYYPNDMSFFQKTGHYGAKVWEFLFAEPRESNTEGGVYPAIFGTVLMTLLMSVAVTPFGVLTAFYLGEYAKDGIFLKLVRIAVNNLAGVPSIVFGVFGLGFLVYGVGGGIDRLFYSDILPTPTFGTGGLIWASLTLALLTLPVVIVATEESIAAVPRGVKEGSLAMGASKFQTILKVVLPASVPGIMTGVILAIARGAGEVAPLMITGVAKMATELPLDGNAPYFHPERKIMHLGFHIYDVGFQSPNIEASKPMVFTTALLLLVIVLALNIVAIVIRDHVKKKYRTGAF